VVPDLGLVLAPIPPGTFTIGSGATDRGFRDTDSPPTRVTLARPFWLGRFEVTQREWERIMPSDPSDFHGEMRPVDDVAWTDAMEFCRRLNDRERRAGRLPAGYAYSLPTEAEWEYACRAGSTGPRAGDLDEMGWYVGNSGSWAHATGPASRLEPEAWRMSTHPVGQKRPNAWGLYDMYGNVLEWCLDWYGPYTGASVTDPMGPATGSARVLRGGGWWTDPEVCTSFGRSKAPPGRHHNALGFRLALRPDSSDNK
jgi:formylglycine-generating enzyme required for sulfatase activity